MSNVDLRNGPEFDKYTFTVLTTMRNISSIYEVSKLGEGTYKIAYGDRKKKVMIE